MRRTKSRRRFHTDRIVRNRQRRVRDASPEFSAVRRLEAGRFESCDPHFGCTSARCHLCHWDKLDPSRRARSSREWQDWLSEYE